MELAEDGYFGVEVRVTPMRTEIIIRATRIHNVLGDSSRDLGLFDRTLWLSEVLIVFLLVCLRRGELGS